MGTRFAPVPLVGTSSDLRADIIAWVSAEPMRALVTEFGGNPDLVTATPATLGGTLAELDVFTDRWDTRNGRERNLAAELDLTDAQQILVLDAADALGLCSARPPRHASYDYVLMLGGLVRACVARPAYAAHLVRNGHITAKSVIALGGHRPFAGDEFDFAEKLGISGVTEEYDAMDAGTRRAFSLDRPEKVEGETSELVGGTWGVRRYRTAEDIPVMVAAAPSTDPVERRANTPDSYAWFADYLVALKPGQRLLMITTPIYVPAQHAAAVRMLQLPYNVEVETIGTDPTVSGGVKQLSTPSKYLQEIRSAVRALRQLHEELPED
jgi:hypothetical protein